MTSRKAVRAKMAFYGYDKGDIFYPPGVYRDELIACGRVERAPEMDTDAPKLASKVKAKVKRRTRKARGGKSGTVESQVMTAGEVRG